MPPLPCSFSLHSPPPGPAGAGAIAIIQLRGDISAAFASLGIAPVPPGRAAVRDWLAIDRVVIARFQPDAALLFPHGGSANLSRVLDALSSAGLSRDLADDPASIYPEAADPLEARMLLALSRAQSPLAIDLLLRQPKRWRRAAADPALRLDDPSSRALRRLIDPPLVVAMGAPNIGKSSLLNALAGRSVAIVADQPGTTRDHVGVTLDLAGLTVRYVDTPGIAPPPPARSESPATSPTPDPILAEAIALGLALARTADLILLCADAGSDFPEPPTPAAPVLRVGLRSDRGPARQGCDIAVSAPTGVGLAQLTSAIRDRLVPPSLLADERAWTFW